MEEIPRCRLLNDGIYDSVGIRSGFRLLQYFYGRYTAASRQQAKNGPLRCFPGDRRYYFHGFRVVVNGRQVGPDRATAALEQNGR